MGEESLQGRALTPPFLLSDRTSSLLEPFISPIFWEPPGAVFNTTFLRSSLIWSFSVEKLSQEVCKVISLRSSGCQTLPENLSPLSHGPGALCPGPRGSERLFLQLLGPAHLDPNSNASGPPSPSRGRSQESHCPRFF